PVDRVQPHQRVVLVPPGLAFPSGPDRAGDRVPPAQAVLAHLRHGDIDVVRSGKVAAGAHEGVVVQHIDDAGYRDQDVVLGVWWLRRLGTAPLAATAPVTVTGAPATSAATVGPVVVAVTAVRRTRGPTATPCPAATVTAARTPTGPSPHAWALHRPPLLGGSRLGRHRRILLPRLRWARWPRRPTRGPGGLDRHGGTIGGRRGRGGRGSSDQRVGWLLLRSPLRAHLRPHLLARLLG